VTLEEVIAASATACCPIRWRARTADRALAQLLVACARIRRQQMRTGGAGPVRGRGCSCGCTCRHSAAAYGGSAVGARRGRRCGEAFVTAVDGELGIERLTVAAKLVGRRRLSVWNPAECTALTAFARPGHFRWVVPDPLATLHGQSGGPVAGKTALPLQHRAQTRDCDGVIAPTVDRHR